MLIFKMSYGQANYLNVPQKTPFTSSKKNDHVWPNTFNDHSIWLLRKLLGSHRIIEFHTQIILVLMIYRIFTQNIWFFSQNAWIYIIMFNINHFFQSEYSQLIGYTHVHPVREFTITQIQSTIIRCSCLLQKK